MQKNESVLQKGFASSILIPIVAVTAYTIICFILSRPFLGWVFFEEMNESHMLSAVRHETENATFNYMLGRYYHHDLIQPDPEKATRHYIRSLDIHPLQPGAWLDLSKAYASLGHKEEAEHALERAVSLSPNNPELMWMAGTFWLINGMQVKAIRTFRKYLFLAPEKQKRVYDLCWKLKLNNTYMLEQLIPESYEYQSTYLLYLLSQDRIEAAEEAWNRIDLDYLDQNLFISYINFLINHRLYGKAQTLWDDITKQIEGLGPIDHSTPIWNPGFENQILNGGFDWTVRETKGVDIFIDDVIKMTGNQSLGVTFDGRHNPDITIARQVVRVKPKTHYTLSGFIKTNAITTRNGIIMQVYGHKCTGLNRKSDAVTGTNLWRELTIDFETPPECNALVARIRREQSAKLDNKIEGTAWIDRITLKERTDLKKNSFKKP
jgi:hypothetical protein